jgi:hypothetical protein
MEVMTEKGNQAWRDALFDGTDLDSSSTAPESFNIGCRTSSTGWYCNFMLKIKQIEHWTSTATLSVSTAPCSGKAEALIFAARGTEAA